MSLKQRMTGWVVSGLAKKFTALSRALNDANSIFKVSLTTVQKLTEQVQSLHDETETAQQKVATDTAASSAALQAIQTIQTALDAGLSSFNRTWLGGHTQDPTVAPDGSAIPIGASYLNETDNAIRVYVGSSSTYPTGWKDADAEYEAMNAAAQLMLQTMQQLAAQAQQSATSTQNSVDLANQYLQALRAYNLFVPDTTMANYIVTISSDGKSYLARSPSDTLTLIGAMGTGGGVFTGKVSGLTAAKDTASTQLATTAFVLNQLGDTEPLMDGAAEIGTSLRSARIDHVHPSDTSRAFKNGDATQDFAAKTLTLTCGDNPASRWTITTLANGNIQFTNTNGGGGFTIYPDGTFVDTCPTDSPNKVVTVATERVGYVLPYDINTTPTASYFKTKGPGVFIAKWNAGLVGSPEEARVPNLIILGCSKKINFLDNCPVGITDSFDYANYSFTYITVRINSTLLTNLITVGDNLPSEVLSTKKLYPSKPYMNVSNRKCADRDTKGYYTFPANTILFMNSTGWTSSYNTAYSIIDIKSFINTVINLGVKIYIHGEGIPDGTYIKNVFETPDISIDPDTGEETSEANLIYLAFTLSGPITSSGQFTATFSIDPNDGDFLITDMHTRASDALFDYPYTGDGWFYWGNGVFGYGYFGYGYLQFAPK